MSGGVTQGSVLCPINIHHFHQYTGVQMYNSANMQMTLLFTIVLIVSVKLMPIETFFISYYDINKVLDKGKLSLRYHIPR